MTTRTFAGGDYPEVASRWSDSLNPCGPEEVTSGSSRTTYYFNCDAGHPYEMTPKDATRRGRGCPYCSGVKVLVGFNDLATTHSPLAKELSSSNDVKATEVTAGSNREVEWVGAECGHTWTAAVKTRVRGATCPYCSNRRILPGFNDVASIFPDLVQDYASDNEKTLEELSPGSKQVVNWVCHHCSHAWSTEVKNRTSKGSGCPSCGRGRNTARVTPGAQA